MEEISQGEFQMLKLLECPFARKLPSQDQRVTGAPSSRLLEWLDSRLTKPIRWV